MNYFNIHKIVTAACTMAEDVAFLSSHPSAFFGTATACLRAFLAVVGLVPVAFSSARVTNVSAHAAELLCELAIH
jgi:hypothetical protein